MQYNLIGWLRPIYPDVKFYMNVARVKDEKLPERYCVVKDTGGNDEAALETFTFQFKIHDIDSNRCKVLAEEIYYTMINNDERGGRFQLTLPSVNVTNIVYPAIKLNSIMPIQKPYCLGLDENNRVMYVFNLIFRRGGRNE